MTIILTNDHEGYVVGGADAHLPRLRRLLPTDYLGQGRDDVGHHADVNDHHANEQDEDGCCPLGGRLLLCRVWCAGDGLAHPHCC